MPEFVDLIGLLIYLIGVNHLSENQLHLSISLHKSKLDPKTQ